MNMIPWNMIPCIGLASALTLAAIIPVKAAAPEQIGLAVTIRNDVSQVEPKISKIVSGDDIVREELVRTNSDSFAKFVLRDDTNLMLGPSSSLRLDRTVFSGQTTAGDIAIKLTSGAFRFVTGHSTKESYSITTQLATIGVRGTTLDFLIDKFRNAVVLQAGQAHVCAGGNCIELMKKGDTAVIRSVGGRILISLDNSSSWSFDGFCGGACNQVTFAAAEDMITTGSIGGSGGGGGPTGTPGATGGTNGGPFANNGNFASNGFRNLLNGNSAGGAGFSQISPH
jgi:hypothetical protein